MNKLSNNLIIYNHGENDYISKSIIKYKCWEPNISCLINIINRENNSGFLIDIGCNIGYFSLLSSPYRKLILSIDGNKNNINLLKKSIEINKINNIIPINICISNEETNYKEGNREIINRNGNIGGLTFLKCKEGNIKSTTIENVINKYNINDILIMKIDIEGGELNALLGCINILKTNIIKYIFIEISPILNNDSIEIIKILIDNNYELFNIPHKETGQLNNNKNYLKYIIGTQKIINIQKFIKNIKQTNLLCKKII